MNEENWVSLFDGKSIDGWIRRGGKAEYRVEDGAIVGTTFKRDGYIWNEVDTNRVREFMQKVEEIRR